MDTLPVSDVMTTHPLAAIMTPERILGALIWAVWHNELSDELIELVHVLPPEYIRALEGDLDVLIQMTQGANLDPVVRPYLVAGLKAEIESTLRMMEANHV